MLSPEDNISKKGFINFKVNEIKRRIGKRGLEDRQ